MLVRFQHVSGTRAGQVDQFQNQGVISCGRAATNMLRFDMYNDIDVSQNHATISWSGMSFNIVDNGSSNGTFVNGQRVNGPMPLQNGSVIEFGAGGPKVQFSFDGKGGQPPAKKTAVKQQGPSKTRVQLEQVQQDLDARQKKGKRNVILVFLLLLVLGGAGVGGFLWYSEDQAESDAMAAREDAEKKLGDIPEGLVDEGLRPLKEKMEVANAKLEESPEEAQKLYKEVADQAPALKEAANAKTDMLKKKGQAENDFDAKTVTSSGWKSLEEVELAVVDKLKAGEYQPAAQAYRDLSGQYKELGEVADLLSRVMKIRRETKATVESLGSLGVETLAGPAWTKANELLAEAEQAVGQKSYSKAKRLLEEAKDAFEDAKLMAREKSSAIEAAEEAQQLGAVNARYQQADQAFMQAEDLAKAGSYEMAAAYYGDARDGFKEAVTEKRLQDQAAQASAARAEERDKFKSELDRVKEELRNREPTLSEAELQARAEAKLKEEFVEEGGDEAAFEEQAQDLSLNEWFAEYSEALVFIESRTFVTDPSDPNPFEISQGRHMGAGFFVTEDGRLLTAKSVAIPWRYSPKAMAICTKYQDLGFKVEVRLTVYAATQGKRGGISWQPRFKTEDETLSVLDVTPGTEKAMEAITLDRVFFKGQTLRDVNVKLDHLTLANMAVLQVVPELDEDEEPETFTTIPFGQILPGTEEEVLAMGFGQAVSVEGGSAEVAIGGPAELILEVFDYDEGDEVIELIGGAAPLAFEGGPVIEAGGNAVGIVVKGKPDDQETTAAMLYNKHLRLLR